MKNPINSDWWNVKSCHLDQVNFERQKIPQSIMQLYWFEDFDKKYFGKIDEFL